MPVVDLGLLPDYCPYGIIASKKVIPDVILSSLRMCWSEHTTLALCNNVLEDTILCQQVVLIVPWRYWSVCVSFLYTVVVRLLLGSRETTVSMKGKAPLSLGFPW